MNPNVTHPPYYNQGKIEVIEAIEDWKVNFHRGNAIKYIARAGRKSNEVEDLEKAVWYLQRDIERIKSVREERETVRPNDMNEKFVRVAIIKNDVMRAANQLLQNPNMSHFVFQGEIVK